MLSRRGGGCGHEGSELVGESWHVGDGGFEVEVETIDDGGAEGARDAGVGDGPEDLPDVGSSGLGSGGGAEATFGVSGSAYAEKDGLAVGGLAGLDVGSVDIVRDFYDNRVKAYSISEQ